MHNQVAKKNSLGSQNSPTLATKKPDQDVRQSMAMIFAAIGQPRTHEMNA
jgi:hypothetical protein